MHQHCPQGWGLGTRLVPLAYKTNFDENHGHDMDVVNVYYVHNKINYEYDSRLVHVRILYNYSRLHTKRGGQGWPGVRPNYPLA